MKLVLLLPLVFCIGTLAQTNDITYQGRLVEGTVATTGTYDFIFKLFDDPKDPAAPQIGMDQVRDDVSVSSGVFKVVLNFGSTAFDGGGERYLEIYVRPGASTGAHVQLTPRQQITSAPFAIQAFKAGSADSLSSACVLCVTDAQIQSVEGSKVSGTVASAANATNATTATNVSGIVQIANGGTGSSTQNFVDLSTNQTNIAGNKTFTGTLSGNGSGLTNVPGTFKWQTVMGFIQQAQPNNGYLVYNNIGAEATITLPTSASVGDVVRVSAVEGSGGWKIAQNAGQSILGVNIGLHGAIWTPRESNRNWYAVASSADGSKLLAAAQNGQLYTSTDSGVSWTPRESNRYWTSVASSANGSKLVAVVGDGQIYTSTDFGVSWTARESNRNWRAVASSSDGDKLVAVIEFGQIYTSTDSGVTWIPRESSRFWQSVASSADGNKLVAVVFGGKIYTSTNSGVSWTERETNRNWQAVASSADGTKIVAADYDGLIHVSTDSGVSWTARGVNASWFSIASSADGSKLIAIGLYNPIFISNDSGLTWMPRDTRRGWQAVASSSDGSKLIAGGSGSRIYISTSATTVGTAGYLTGGQSSAIELQYIGNGQFVPLSYSGTLVGF